MKKCNWCGDEKTLAEFYKHPSTKDKLQSNCKPCQRELARKNYRRIIGGKPRPYKRRKT